MGDSEKTEAELRAIRALIEANTAFEDFPDGVTWDDWNAAMALPEETDDAR